MSHDAPTPKWFWPVLAALACIEPATHAWITYSLPVGAVPTGMHTGDSGHHLVCMRIFETDFFSPFATCRAPHGPHYFGYFAPPLFLLYGVLGLLRRMLDADPFLFLGFANGAGGALYLLAAYRFLREAIPRLANRAFLLFALGGGLGGVLYVITGALGLHDTPHFEEYFRRYAHYELIEGPSLAPSLLIPRLYYTLPLSALLFGLAALFRAERTGSRRAALGAAVLLCAAAFVNIRLGPPACAIALAYLCCSARGAGRWRAQLAALAFVGIAVGGGCAWPLIRMSPAYVSNMKETVRMSMWLSPFLSAIVFHLFVIPRAVRRDVVALPMGLRILSCGILGYLAVFVLLYAGYQIYYGNLWRCLDVTVAVRMSDWALAGVVAGVAYGMLRGVDGAAHDTAWVTLWFLGFVAVAVSAFGQGWFMQFNPQRLMVFLGLPLAVLCAEGIALLAAERPRLAKAFMVTIVGCGVCSTLVAASCFQGPLGRVPGKGPFAYLHYESMPRNDADMLNLIEEGVVVTPPWSPILFGEIVALRPGLSVLGGAGAMNISDQAFRPLQEEVTAFFDAKTSEGDRRAFASKWCVDYIYCPEMCPVSADVLAQFRAAQWLRETAAEGGAVLFKVVAE